MVKKRRMPILEPAKAIIYEAYVKCVTTKLDPIIRELAVTHKIVITKHQLNHLLKYGKWAVARNIYANWGIYYDYQNRWRYRDLPKDILDKVDIRQNINISKLPLVDSAPTNYDERKMTLQDKNGKTIKLPKKKYQPVENQCKLSTSNDFPGFDQKTYDALCSLAMNPRNIHLSLYRIIEGMKCLDFYNEYRKRYTEDGFKEKRDEMIRFYEEDMLIEKRYATNQNEYLGETMMNQALKDEMMYLQGNPTISKHWDYLGQKEKQRQRRLEPKHIEMHRIQRSIPQTAIQINNAGGKTTTVSQGGAFDNKQLSPKEIEAELTEYTEVIRQLERKLPTEEKKDD